MRANGASKVSKNGAGGRITLPTDVLAALDVQIGDTVQFYEDNGRLYIQKIGVN